MSQYDDLDGLILARLKQSSARFYQLEHTPEIAKECKRIDELTGRDAFRILDGRLAALRKSGLIIPGRKHGWSLV